MPPEDHSSTRALSGRGKSPAQSWSWHSVFRDMLMLAETLRCWSAGVLRLEAPLPPGTIGPKSISNFADDDFYRARRRRHGPIFKLVWSRRVAIAVVGFPTIRRLLREHGDDLAPVPIDINAIVPGGFMRAMTSPVHETYRGRFAAAMHADLLTAREAELRAIVTDELARLAGAIDAGGEPGALLTPAVARITLRWLILLMVGLAPEDPRFAALEQGFLRLGPDELHFIIGPEERAAYHEIEAQLRSLSPASLGDGVLRRLGPTDPTLLGNLIYMIEMGRYDLRGLLRWTLKYLADHPPVVAELRGRAATGEGLRDFAQACVQETLRLDQAEAQLRAVRRSFTFDGYRFPAGTMVRLLLRESHQEAAASPEPAAYCPHRFLAAAPRSDDYAPFGVGDHRCIAAQLSVRLATLFVEALTTGFDWQVASDGERHRGRYHWEPSPAFGIALRPRAP